MRWLLVLVLFTGVAHASEGGGSGMVGAGSSMATGAPGWMLRLETRIDYMRTHLDDAAPVAGGMVGLEFWGSGGRTGFCMPLGYFVGAQVKSVRTTLGGGLGLWAFEFDGSGQTHGGVAPFASGSIEITVENMIVSLDGRLARQVVSDIDDFNVYSVMFMVGKRIK